MLAAIQTVNVHHDALDYLAALGGLVGGIAAVVALIVAIRSKKDAARSAAAAEAAQALANEHLKIARHEAEAAETERKRRAAPEIQVTAKAVGMSDDAPPMRVVLSVAFSNDNGTRAVERLGVNVLVPDSMELIAADDEDGNGVGSGRILHSPGHHLGTHHGAVYWADMTLGPINVGDYLIRYLTLRRVVPGAHEVWAELSNEDLPGGHSKHAWRLQIPPSGDRLEIQPLPHTAEGGD